MQRKPHLFRPRALAAAVLVGAPICGAVAALTPVVATAEEAAPAELIQLSGPTAKELDAYECAEPVMIAHTKRGWAALVYQEHAEDIPAVLERLLVKEVHGPGCVPEGPVECCNEATGIFAIHVKSGWLHTGKRCEKPTGNETGVEVVTVPQALTRRLFDEAGVTDEYMDCPKKPDGTLRMLWNSPPVTPLKEGQLLQPQPILQSSGAPRISSVSLMVGSPGTSPPIILAHGHPPPSPSCVNTRPPSCRSNGDNQVCHETRRHWYVKSSTTGQWCHRSGCSC